MTDVAETIAQSERMVIESRKLMARLNNDMTLFHISYSRQLIERSELLLQHLLMIEQRPWWQHWR